MLRGNQQEIVTAQANLEVQQHTVEITTKLYKVGFDSGLDLANAQETVATTEAQIPVYETEARQAIYALSVLLGPAAGLPDGAPVAHGRPARPAHAPFPPGCLPTCSAAGPTCARPRPSCTAPPRRSASPWPTCSRSSP